MGAEVKAVHLYPALNPSGSVVHAVPARVQAALLRISVVPSQLICRKPL